MEQEDNKKKELVNTYLKRVKKHLPGWLKKDIEEQRKIFAQIEEEIWKKAEDLAETEEPTEKSVRLALVQMGTPREALKEYKRRGTPKVYITEEWWPYYKKWMIGTLVFVVFLHVVSFLYHLFVDSLTAALASLNIYASIGGTFIVITVIFTVFSMEGYLPEDFNLKTKPLHKRSPYGISPDTGEMVKPIVKPTESIIGGIATVIFGGIIAIVPFLSISSLIHPDFFLILHLGGSLMILEGVTEISRGLLGNERVTGQQSMFIISAGLNIASIPVIYMILQRPEIFPLLYYSADTNAWANLQIPLEYYQTFQNIFVIIIFLQILSATYTIYKAGALEKYKLLKRTIKRDSSN